MFNLKLSHELNPDAPVCTLDEILSNGHSILSVEFAEGRKGGPSIESRRFLELCSKYPTMNEVDALNLTVKSAPDYDQWKDALFLPYEDRNNELFSVRWISLKDMHDFNLDGDLIPSGSGMNTLADQIFHQACSIAYTDVDKTQKAFLFDLLKKEAIALFNPPDYNKYTLSAFKKQIRYLIKAGIKAAKNNIQLTTA